MVRDRGVMYALAAAFLFGASTPLCKLLVGDVSPLLLAGLLYFASGLGLAAVMLLTRNASRGETRLRGNDALWLGGAILAGGVLGPALLMSGLSITSGATASLLLNLESVLTALVAWCLFREHFHRRIGIGMLAIAAGGVLLSWDGGVSVGSLKGPLLIAAACFAWAVDNNLTRNVSAADPVMIACLKGLIAGSVNIALALTAGSSLPGPAALAAVAAVGLAGYGASLVLFVLALRGIGTARTGAYFATAPFAGTVLSLIVLREQPTAILCVAALFMLAGVWLHITEDHDHEHSHDDIEHSHAHVHDAHHQHAHAFVWDSPQSHSHAHHHQDIRHAHPHFPDIHHRHGHVARSSTPDHRA